MIFGEWINALNKDLEAIEHSIKLHEIPIDLSLLGEIRPHQNSSLFKRGVLTQSIYKALAMYPNKWISTTNVTALVMSLTDTEIDNREFLRLRETVKRRLKPLAYQGKVDRINTGLVNEEGLWRQTPSYRKGITYLEAPPEDDCLANILENIQINLTLI